MLFYTQKD